ELETRMPLLLSFVAVITAAKLFGSLVVDPWRERRALRAESATFAAVKTGFSNWFTPFALGFIVIYPILIMVLVGPQGALKWVDNFGIQILINWVSLTGGYAGISGVPRPTLFGIPFNASDEGFAATFGLEFSPIYRTLFLYYVIVALAMLTAYVTIRLRQLPVGRAWEALRE